MCKDRDSNHSFFYENFKDIIEDWKEEQVIEGLEYQKGFYYPSKSNVSLWVEIQTSNKQNESFRLSS